MNDKEIKVIPYKVGDRKNYVLCYYDPINGKKIKKSAGTANKQEAYMRAAEWERELRRSGRGTDGRITWDGFRSKYEEEKVLEPASLASTISAFNHLERILGLTDDSRLANLTATALSKFQATLRKEKMKETTIAQHLRHIKAALNWAANQKLMFECPHIEFSKRAKGDPMKSRPITTEEYERMLLAAEKLRPDDFQEWQNYMALQFHSGLRRAEAFILTWHEGPFHLEVQGDNFQNSQFVIQGQQKSGNYETLPCTPEFVEWLRETFPDACERSGKVVTLPTDLIGTGRVVEKIGRKANIKVGMRSKKVKDKKTGKIDLVEVPVFAGCHSLRRAFATTWSRKVMPAVLKVMMRHADISTTMKYYVNQSTADLRQAIWANTQTSPSPTPPAPKEPESKAANRDPGLRGGKE